MIDNLYIQIIGYGGLFLSIIRLFYNDRSKILSINSVSNLFYSIHYYLLGAFTGSATTLIASIRSLIFKERTKKKWADNPLWFYFFLLITLAAGFFTWVGPLSMLPLIAAIMLLTGSWLKNPKYLRLLYTIAMVFWFIYAYYVGSTAVMISSILIFISGIINIIRHDILKKPDKITKFF